MLRKYTNWDKLSCISLYIFSRFEGTRGDKTKYLASRALFTHRKVLQFDKRSKFLPSFWFCFWKIDFTSWFKCDFKWEYGIIKFCSILVMSAKIAQTNFCNAMACWAKPWDKYSFWYLPKLPYLIHERLTYQREISYF